MRYPFNMKKWINFNYKLNKIQTVVLSKDNWIIGYGGVKFIEKNNRAHIAQIFLDPDHRGNGYRAKIIDYIENISINNKLNALTINVMNKDKTALDLYKNLGFVEMEELGNKLYMIKKIS